MAYPTVISRTTYVSGNVNATTWNAFSNITVSVGDFLVFIVGIDGTATPASTTSDGWQLLAMGDGPGLHTSAVFYKTATTTSEAFTLTYPVAEQYSGILYRVSGANIVVGTSRAGSFTSEDPPNLVVGDSGDYLFLAAVITDTQTSIASAPPSGYSNLTTRLGSTNGVAVSVAEKTATAASEDPGAFTVTDGDYIVWTLAILQGSSPVATDVPDLVHTKSLNPERTKRGILLNQNTKAVTEIAEFGVYVPTGTAWNPADKGASITLSGNNLVATTGGSRAGVRSTTSKSSGKWVARLVFNIIGPSGQTVVSIANSSADYSTYLGDANSVLLDTTGLVVGPSNFEGAGGSLSNGTEVLVEVNVDTRQVWFRYGGVKYGPYGAPATGNLFLLFQGAGTGQQGTAEFTGTGWTQTPTSGFSYWDASGIVVRIKPRTSFWL